MPEDKMLMPEQYILLCLLPLLLPLTYPSELPHGMASCNLSTSQFSLAFTSNQQVMKFPTPCSRLFWPSLLTLSLESTSLSFLPFISVFLIWVDPREQGIASVFSHLTPNAKEPLSGYEMNVRY